MTSRNTRRFRADISRAEAGVAPRHERDDVLVPDAQQRREARRERQVRLERAHRGRVHVREIERRLRAAARARGARTPV